MTVRTTKANGIEIAYETFGNESDRPMLLVMGLGTQMVAWPDELCQELADQGRYVVRFDNRDVGLSTHLTGVTAPGYVDSFLRRAAPPYTIEDMADDAIGLMDALGFDRVDLVGASMGGFIAQTVAVRATSRVRTLTLIMTSTGSRRVGQPKLGVFLRLMRARVADDRRSAQAAAVETYRMIGSKGFAFDEEFLMDVVGRSYDRAYDPSGYIRQLAAVGSQPNRSALLSKIRVPSLVIHGLHDPLVATSGGLAVAQQLHNAKFVGFSGMGHDLPRELWPEIAREIGALTARAAGVPG